MTIPLKAGIIYGPVNSRRLGRSLGINLLPRGTKICTFNCVYCQYGWTKIHGRSLPDNKEWPAPEVIFSELKKFLENSEIPPEYLTFSGNGEPTLHPHFPEIVQGIITIRDELAPPAKTAILSNSSTVTETPIREALRMLDVRIMKLDCGNAECFTHYNQPTSGVEFSEVIEGLRELDKVTIQSLFADGDGGNYTPSSIEDWIVQLKIIHPVFVQIYSLDRGYPSDNIYPLSVQKLNTIRDYLNLLNIPSQVFHR
jgi:wyosine [tRNA(Phe)-imidazoG37] synthetase (radical SAM superfamily)